MTFKANDFEFEIISNKIEFLYQRLESSSQNVIRMADADSKNKGIFDPKEDKIIESTDNDEFLIFQALMKNLNTYVYYNSLLLVSYSLFEFSLKLMCAFVCDHLNPKIVFDGNQGDTLNNCRNYLISKTKVIDIKQNNFETSYTQLKNVNYLRNRIAHHNGNLIRDKSKLLKDQVSVQHYILDKHLTIMEDGQIYISDSDYIKDFIHKSKIFLTIILEKLKSNN